MPECLGIFLNVLVDSELEIGGWRVLNCLDGLVLAALLLWWMHRRSKRKEDKRSAEDPDHDISSDIPHSITMMAMTAISNHVIILPWVERVL